jgi:hypothetical protein
LKISAFAASSFLRADTSWLVIEGPVVVAQAVRKKTPQMIKPADL